MRGSFGESILYFPGEIVWAASALGQGRSPTTGLCPCHGTGV